MPSHQDRRDPLPPDYQFGDMKHYEDSRVTFVKRLMDRAFATRQDMEDEYLADTFRYADSER